MKRNTLILIGAGLLAASSFANAAEPLQTLPAKIVTGISHSVTVACTPPDDRAVCVAWHQEIRRNFTPREIGMLFGARTSYPNYDASFDRVQARYNALQGEFATAHAAELNAIASK